MAPYVSGTVTYTIPRAPSGSTASFTENAFTPDKPGRYVIRAAWSLFARSFELVAFDAGIATWPVIATIQRGPSMGAPRTDWRNVLAAIASEASASGIASEMERDPQLGNFGLNATLFGNTAWSPQMLGI